MMHPCGGGDCPTCEFTALANEIRAAGSFEAWGTPEREAVRPMRKSISEADAIAFWKRPIATPKAKPVALLIKAHQPTPTEIHRAAVARLATISARATELARAGKVSSHEAALLDGAIYAQGQRLQALRPKR